jgi:hypothetical protein
MNGQNSARSATHHRPEVKSRMAERGPVIQRSNAKYTATPAQAAEMNLDRMVDHIKSKTNKTASTANGL